MEAKDTVMSENEFVWPKAIRSGHSVDYVWGYKQGHNDGRNVQAKISFMAGIEEGFILSKVTDPVLLSGADHEELNRRAKAFLDDLKKAGIREVVEWGNETCKEHSIGNLTQRKRECKLCWQSKLKEWGIE